MCAVKPGTSWEHLSNLSHKLTYQKLSFYLESYILNILFCKQDINQQEVFRQHIDAEMELYQFDLTGKRFHDPRQNESFTTRLQVLVS